MRSLKDNKSDVNREDIAQRRTFLKKTMYAAPTLMVLGSLTKPTQTHADFGPPPSDPKSSISVNQSGASDTSEDVGNGGDFDTGNNNEVIIKTLDSEL